MVSPHPTRVHSHLFAALAVPLAACDNRRRQRNAGEASAQPTRKGAQQGVTAPSLELRTRARSDSLCSQAGYFAIGSGGGVRFTPFQLKH
jgi:hypothetical protein